MADSKEEPTCPEMSEEDATGMEQNVKRYAAMLEHPYALQALLKKILCVICLVGVGACAWPVDCIVVILATNDRLFLVLGKVLVRDMKGFEHHRTWPKSCTLEVEAV